MPAYAGFASLEDYLIKRCREHGISFRELSESIGATYSYVQGVAAGSFAPSLKRLDAIAAYFGDAPRLPRILAGLETLPLDEDRDVTEIKDIIANLPARGRRELIEFARFVKQKFSDKSHGD